MGKGFPKKIMMTHRYVESFVNWGSTAGSVFKANISCNSLYDPNRYGAGHQPYYFDQLGAIYNHYTVIGSKITVKLTPITQNTAPTFVGIFINDDTTTTPSDIDSLNELSGKIQKLIGYPSSDTYTLRSKWSAKKAFGKNILANTLFRGSTSASPTEEQFWTIFMQDAGATQTQSFAVQITVEYITVWSELKDIAGS